ncbi:hypothetical protein DFH09DRAFT_1100908 [Mycena vulgaris]|nr:hypothetical protein DFH09DRAFT_1100908 [Mycena vulgaris]
MVPSLIHFLRINLTSMVNWAAVSIQDPRTSRIQSKGSRFVRRLSGARRGGPGREYREGVCREQGTPLALPRPGTPRPIRRAPRAVHFRTATAPASRAYGDLASLRACSPHRQPHAPLRTCPPSALVLARSGSGIGSNLNWTEPNAAFRFRVHRMAEPNARFTFGVRALRPAFEPGPNAEPESHKRLTHAYVLRDPRMPGIGLG